MDKRLIGFYLDALVASLFFFTPIYSVAYFTNIGFSLAQIGLFLGVTSLASVLAEIPTGVVADLYGRKKSTIIGYLVVGVSTLLIFLLTGFTGLIFAHIIMGVGRSFVSGANDAWLRHLVGEKKFEKIFGHLESLTNVALVLSGFVGVFIVTQLGMRYMWLIVFFSYILGALFLTMVPDNFKPKKISHPYKDYIKQLTLSTKVIKKSKNLQYFFISLIIFAILIPLGANITWIPLFLNLGLNEAALGYIWSGMSAIGIFAPLLGNKIVEKYPRKQFNVIMMLSWSICLLFIPFVNILSIVIGILLLTVLFDYSRFPSFMGLFHSFLPEKYRATLGSVMGLLFSLGLIIGEPLAGFLSQTISPQWTLFIAGVLLLPAAYIFSKVKE